MTRSAFILRAAFAALFGLGCTAAGTHYAMTRVGSGPWIRGGLTLVAADHSTVVVVRADRWSVTIGASTSVKLPKVPSDPDHAILEALRTEGVLDGSYRAKERLPASALTGLSPPVWLARKGGTGLNETAVGWPFRCLIVRGRAVNAGPIAWSEIPARFRGVRGWEINAVQTALSIATFGGPLLVLLVAPGMLRRALRRRRGRCVTCGYDLAGNTAPVCPECGTPRKVKPNPPGS